MAYFWARLTKFLQFASGSLVKKRVVGLGDVHDLAALQDVKPLRPERVDIIQRVRYGIH